MTTDLCDLAILYRADKCPQYNHTYTPQYHALLSSIRNETNLLLEIGIGNIPLMQPLTSHDYTPGASLRMWRDYFPNARIIGCDILQDVQFEDTHITTFVTDQSNASSLNELIQRIEVIHPHADIIIDDGSHEEEHMVTSFKTLWRLLKPNGIYIIEDIRTSFFDRINNLYNECGFSDATILQSYRGDGFWDNFVAFRKSSL